MSQQGGSGNRWEPAPGPGEPPGRDESAGRLDGSGAPDDTTEPIRPSPEPPPRSGRGRALLAAGAAAVLLGSGAGGYALGHAGAGQVDDGGPGPFARHRGPGLAPGRPGSPPGADVRGHDDDGARP